jgi:FkbM family methyltransferase
MLIDFRKLFPKYNLKFSGVLHIGANIGEEAPVYAELGIHNQIWFEANPDIYEKLLNNLREYPFATAYNFCVGDEGRKFVTLHVSSNGSQSSSVLELGTHKIEHPDVTYIDDIVVPMVTVEDFFKAGELRGYNLLNIDVQGYELHVLRGMGNLISQFKAVYTEVNRAELYEGCAQIEDIDKFLGERGFTRVETHWAPNKNWGDALYVQWGII